MFCRLFGPLGVSLLVAACVAVPASPGDPNPPMTDVADGSEVPGSNDAGPAEDGGSASGSCTGSSAAPGACEPKFASGLNMAWVNYARDVPNPDLAVFDTVFNNTHENGGRVVRWWFHVDGSSTPGYGADGNALPISCSNIADVRSILDHAAAAKVMVVVSLWSFTMLDGSLDPELLANNMNLLTNDSSRQAYIDNYLKPLIAAVGGHPGLYGWEIFNEPEGMSNLGHYTTALGDGGPSPAVDESFIQTTLNWFADAIHGVDPAALVTTGTWKFQFNSNAPGMTNYYSDSSSPGRRGAAPRRSRFLRSSLFSQRRHAEFAIYKHRAELATRQARPHRRI